MLVLKPDIVVAGRFTKRATRELLKQKGLRVAEFDAPRSLDDAQRQIAEMGELIGHPERAAAENARLDAAVARARAAASRARYRVLALARRGWVSGGDSLDSSLLAAAGLSNAAGELGRQFGGFVTLERSSPASRTCCWSRATAISPRTRARPSCCTRRWRSSIRRRSASSCRSG